MKFITALLSALPLLVALNAQAADDILKPFILGSKGPGTVAEKTEQAKTALTGAGFSVVGKYSPYADAQILIVTSDELKKNAAASEHGGFGAIQRVAVTKVNNDVQVSYTNPIYMANAYRMKGDLKGTASAMEKALGKSEEFGANGMTATQVRKYHYMVGMEYFDEPSLLAEYDNYEEAVKAVERKTGKQQEWCIQGLPVERSGQEGERVRGSDER